ncbi:MAG: hypothetical protein J6R45_00060 [Clostridia bacterium]|nr:hypothetical protein [Clostridia bacterium]
MKKTLSVWNICGFLFVSALGVFLHFLYDLTGENRLAALFSGVNESVWEHIKLLYFPLLLFAIIQSFFFKNRFDFWCIKLIGSVIGIVSIPAIFYTANGAFGKTPDWFNITIFFIAAAIVFFIEWQLFMGGLPCRFLVFRFLYFF